MFTEISPLLRYILIGVACFFGGAAIMYWYMNLALQSQDSYSNGLLNRIHILEQVQKK